MKIQVCVIIKSGDVNSPLELVVNPSDTVAMLKETVTSVQEIPFPDQELSFDGKVLQDESRLYNYGILEGCSLKLEVNATEATLAKQLIALLQGKNLSADELGYLYSYKHGANISQALNLLGFEGKIEDFIVKQKLLSINDGSIGAVKSAVANTAAPNVKGQKRVCLQGYSTPTCDAAETTAQEIIDTSSLMWYSPQAPDTSQIAIESNLALDAVEEQQYVDLHSSIYSKAFNAKATRTVKDLIETLSQTASLDIAHVVTGGSIGKSTAICGVADAEVVLYLRGLPADSPETWLPGHLRDIVRMLSDKREDLGIDVIQIVDGSIMMRWKDAIDLTAKLVISPVFETYAETIEILGDQVVFGEAGPEALRFYTAAFAKEQTQFVARQPSSVKMTIRLMKWWRDQQQWSSDKTTPSDELLELVTIYCAVQTRQNFSSSDQKAAIANVMSLLTRFKKLKIVWSNHYSKDDVWGPLLRQRPLVMDPANPFVNVADPRAFKPSELMDLARTTRFFG
jgi:hypothetical protein